MCRSDPAKREPRRGYLCFHSMVLSFSAHGLEKQALLWRQPRNPSRARSDGKRRPHLPRPALQLQRHLQRALQSGGRSRHGTVLMPWLSGCMRKEERPSAEGRCGRYRSMRQRITWHNFRTVPLQRWYGRLVLVEAALTILGAACALGTGSRFVLDAMWMSMVAGLFVWPFVEFYIRDRRRLKKPEATLARRIQRQRDTRGAHFVFWWLILLAVAFGAWNGMNSSGWIPHTQVTTITAKANWLDGELKRCVSYPMDARTASAADKSSGYAVSKLYCDGGTDHQISVTFWGRLAQPEYDVVDWRCKRNSDSFTCYELSGERFPTQR